MNTRVFPHEYLGTLCLKVSSSKPRTRAMTLGEHRSITTQKQHMYITETCKKQCIFDILRRLHFDICKNERYLNGLNAPSFYKIPSRVGCDALVLVCTAVTPIQIITPHQMNTHIFPHEYLGTLSLQDSKATRLREHTSKRKRNKT